MQRATFEEIREKGEEMYPHIEEFTYTFDYCANIDLHLALMSYQSDSVEEIQ